MTETTRERALRLARMVGPEDFRYDIEEQYITLKTEEVMELIRLTTNEALERAALKCMELCSVIQEPHEFERCAEAVRAMKEE